MKSIIGASKRIKRLCVIKAFSKVTSTAQIIAAWVEWPDLLMVRYDIGIKPTPQATANIRIPMKGTFCGYNLVVKIKAQQV